MATILATTATIPIPEITAAITKRTLPKTSLPKIRLRPTTPATKAPIRRTNELTTTPRQDRGVVFFLTR
jgi:hypothetical protein